MEEKIEDNKTNKKLIITYIKILENELKIFGSQFVKNNEDNCYIIYRNESIKLKEKLFVEKYQNNIVIELILKNPIIDYFKMINKKKKIKIHFEF